MFLCYGLTGVGGGCCGVVGLECLVAAPQNIQVWEKRELDARAQSGCIRASLIILAVPGTGSQKSAYVGLLREAVRESILEPVYSGKGGASGAGVLMILLVALSPS